MLLLIFLLSIFMFLKQNDVNFLFCYLIIIRFIVPQNEHTHPKYGLSHCNAGIYIEHVPQNCIDKKENI